MVTIATGDDPKPITLIVPYYENARFLGTQIEIWNGYPAELLRHFRAIVVDDGSPEHPAEPVLRAASRRFRVDLFRIEVDVRWNWLAARNIGVFHADGWCLLTDIDHVLTADVLHGLIYGRHDPAVIYRFSRREHDGAPLKPHPNSWLMTDAMFWKIGGYDEALSGHYGTDGEYRRRCAATAPVRIQAAELVRYEFVADSSTTRYLRKQPEDRAVKRLVAARGPDWRPRTLSFPWRKVAL